MAARVTAQEVFLSYSREPEIVPFVQKLKLDLESEGISVWLDTDDIKAGSDWHGAIGTGLDECRALLCVLSRKYIHSRYCTSELYTANADGKLIFPVLYDEINFSENERSRGVKYVVSGLSWTMCRPGKDEYRLALEKLIKGMKGKGLGQNQLDGVQGKLADMSLNDSSSDPPPSYKDSIAGSPKPLPQKAMKLFEVGMRLEAVDRKFPYFVCAAHIEEVKLQEGKVKVHFDGWTSAYDYWTDSEAVDLHPVGWCERNGWEIQKPGSASGGAGFVWRQYLQDNGFKAAPDECFVQKQLDGLGSLHFCEGMYLEAEHNGSVYVGQVVEVQMHANGEVKVRLEKDGSTHSYKKTSTDIHPPMWSGKNDRKLTTRNVGFRWSTFLGGQAIIPAPAIIFNSEQRSLPPGAQLPGVPVAAHAFGRGLLPLDVDDLIPHLAIPAYQLGQEQRNFPLGGLLPGVPILPHPFGRGLQPVQHPLFAHLDALELELEQDEHQEAIGGFRVNRKLEAKDLKNPGLICVATITDIRRGKLNIHFDGWDNNYDYRCEPNFKEIHPIGWCSQHGHALQKPYNYGRPFSWDEYLAETGAEAVPVNSFTEQQRQ